MQKPRRLRWLCVCTCPPMLAKRTKVPPNAIPTLFLYELLHALGATLATAGYRTRPERMDDKIILSRGSAVTAAALVDSVAQLLRDAIANSKQSLNRCVRPQHPLTRHTSRTSPLRLKAGASRGRRRAEAGAALRRGPVRRSAAATGPWRPPPPCTPALLLAQPPPGTRTPSPPSRGKIRRTRTNRSARPTLR